MQTLIKRMIELGRRDPKPLANMTLKVAEEAGELAEAVNFHEGFLAHKQMKEPLEGEVADVINCAIGVLVKAYPHLTDAALYALLETMLALKADKWGRVLRDLEEARI
jgi:hypothetical protein